MIIITLIPIIIIINVLVHNLIIVINYIR